jgi:hypothetical protein
MIDLKFKDNILRTADTLIYKARNILSTQEGYLHYAPTFGIDYDLFFGQDYKIQTQTFKSYAISKLAENGINPLEVLSQEGTFDTLLNIQIQIQN